MGLSREQFQQLADAQKVEYRIFRDEFQRTGEGLVGIKMSCDCSMTPLP